MQRAAILSLFLVRAADAVRDDARSSGFLALRLDSLGAEAVRMQPEVVAHSLVAVENEWNAQAGMFAECNASAATRQEIEECAAAPKAFEKACNTVVSAVVQASSGEKADVAEYMSNVCSEDILKGWRSESCQSLSSAITAGMSDDAYDNREHFDAGKLCVKFWTKFSSAEVKRVQIEKAARDAEEKKAADERAEEEKKKAAEDAEAEKKEAEEKAAAETKEAEEKKAAEEAEATKEAEEQVEKEAKQKAEAERVAAVAEVKLAEADKKLTESPPNATAPAAAANATEEHEAAAPVVAADTAAFAANTTVVAANAPVVAANTSNTVVAANATVVAANTTVAANATNATK